MNSSAASTRQGEPLVNSLREDISLPLAADAFIGLGQEDLGRVKKVALLGVRFQFLESLKPKFLKRRMEFNVFQILGKLIRLIPAICEDHPFAAHLRHLRA